ncbi:MAG: hypothetical protein ACRDNS_35350, partial [Trebonia sp.]
MTTHEIPATTRRRFIMPAAAVGLGAACVPGLAASSAGGSAPPAVNGLADAVLDAFRRNRLVGVGELHGGQTHDGALTLLLSDQRRPGVVDDIVAEFGNGFYQDTIDRFAGRPVADADLRRVS